MLRREMIGLGLCAALSPAARAAEVGELVYFGTREGSISAARFDAQTGRLTPLGIVSDVERPFWLTAHPDLPLVYALSDLPEGRVHSLAVDQASGMLRRINSVSSGGGGPNHMAIAQGGETAFVANFSGGQVSAIGLRPDGALQAPSAVMSDYGSGPHRRQAAPHAHGVTVDPTGRFVLAPDFGADRVFVYGFDPATRTLYRASPPFQAFEAGSGPRRVVFHPGAPYAYVVTELNAQIHCLRWNARAGRLTPVQTLPIDRPGFAGDRSAAEMGVSRDGRFVYVSNRGDDTIVVYAVDPRKGVLEPAQRIPSGGKTPWSFAIHPSQRWMLVANQGDDTVTVLRLDPDSGRLSPHGRMSTSKPVNVTFLRSGR